MTDHQRANMHQDHSPGDEPRSYPKRLEGTFDTLMAQPGMRSSAGSTISSISCRSTSSLLVPPPGSVLDVFLRVRPAPDDLKENAESKTIELRSASTIAHRSSSGNLAEYTFSGVLSPAASQEDVYQRVAAPLVESLIEGRNGLLFAYGVTNSGKTYSVNGTKESPGIVPRSLSQIFAQLASERSNAGSLLSMRYLEIYNEQIYDLLAEPEDAITGKRKALRLAQGASGGVEVKGLASFSISNLADGMRLVEQGSKNRHCSSTGLNQQSSRSHSVLCIELKRPGRTNPSVLWITDLAGSERGARTGASARGSRQNEANAINTSLMLLFRCLRSLLPGSSGGALPYRDSKLTHLFQSHLNGLHATGRTVMLVCVSPMAADFSETQHVLQNSTLAQQVSTAPDERQIKRAATRMRATHGTNGRRLPPKRPHGSAFPEKELPSSKRSSGDTEYLSANSQSLSASTLSSIMDPQVLNENEELKAENATLKFELERTIEALEDAKEGLQEQEMKIRDEVATEWSERIEMLQEEWKKRMVAGEDAHGEKQTGCTQDSPVAPVTELGTESGCGQQRVLMSRVAMSARKANEAKLVAYINELEESKMEVEDEMERLRQRHKEELAALSETNSKLESAVKEHMELLCGSRREVKELHCRVAVQEEELERTRGALREAQKAWAMGSGGPEHVSTEDFPSAERSIPVLDPQEVVDAATSNDGDRQNEDKQNTKSAEKVKTKNGSRTPIANRLRSRVRNVFRK